MNIEDYSCLICHEILYQPYSFTCGHNACKLCVKKDMNKCPYCKCEFRYKDLKVNNILDQIIHLTFPLQYKEKESFIKKYQKILEKKEEYLRSKYRDNLKERVRSYIDQFLLTSVYKCTDKLNIVYSENYTYEQVIYEFIMLSKYDSLIKIYGPYIRNENISNLETQLNDKEIQILGWLYLLKRFDNIDIRNKMFKFMEETDKNIFLYPININFYQNIDENINNNYIEKNIDFIFDSINNKSNPESNSQSNPQSNSQSNPESESDEDSSSSSSYY